MTPDTSNPPLQSIGSYDLVEKIAEGGMGSIYKARHRETGQIVAIKVMPKHLANNPVRDQLMECGDWAISLVRQFLYSEADAVRMKALVILAAISASREKWKDVDKYVGQMDELATGSPEVLCVAANIAISAGWSV